MIGTDGVKSVTLKHLLGTDHPALSPKNHDGWIWIRRNFSVEEVNTINPDLMKSVPIFCGHGGMINCMPLHMGKSMSLAIVQAPKHKASDTETFTAEEVKVQEVPDAVEAVNFADWTKSARDVVELGCRDPITDWKLADHDPAPFYTKNRIVMAGDAAHATMPFAGQGAGQSLEDGIVLTALFEHVQELKDIEYAFAAYDAVRRPRSQKITELSREYGRIYAFMEPGIEDDLDKIRQRMYEGEMFASQIDIEQQNKDTTRRFKALKDELE